MYSVLSAEEVLSLWERYRPLVFSLGKNIAAALVIIVAGRVAAKGAIRLINNAARNTSGGFRLDETIAAVLRNVVRYGVFVICLIMILNSFGVNTASLIAVLGAAGVAIGLALKDTLGNIAAGIILLFLGSFRKGDYIEFAATAGTVKEINLFTTILETPDGLFISAPNSSIWGTPLKNYSRNGKRRLDLGINISYSDSIDTALQVLKDIVAEENRFLKEPAPQIVVQSLGESSVNLVLRAWAANELYWSIYWDQMRLIRDRLKEAGLSVPFPQRNLRIIGKNGAEGIKGNL